VEDNFKVENNNKMIDDKEDSYEEEQIKVEERTT